jgi:hypothetical protein
LSIDFGIERRAGEGDFFFIPTELFFSHIMVRTSYILI